MHKTCKLFPEEKMHKTCKLFPEEKMHKMCKLFPEEKMHILLTIAAILPIIVSGGDCMTRSPRKIAQSQTYHVVARGNNQQDIFLEDADFSNYLQHLRQACSEEGLTLYAYCLMTNHVHLLVKEGNVALSEQLRKLNSKYARYLNNKYESSGHVFQDRFFSAPVDDDRYFLAVLRYIHRNPLKAGMTKGLSYRWSSYDEYVDHPFIVDAEFALSILSGLDEFIALHEPDEDTLPLVIEPGHKLTKLDEMRLLLRCAGVTAIEDLDGLSAKALAVALQEANARGLSAKKLEQLTGFSRRKIKSLLVRPL